MTAPAIRLARIYDEPRAEDGMRILVDRLWPRGVRKDAAQIDAWLPEVAPSKDLRTWFNHAEERFAEFARRYREELRDNPEFAALVQLIRAEDAAVVTLVFAARDRRHNQAVVLADELRTALAR